MVAEADLTKMYPAAAREEIVSRRKKLEDLFGATIDHSGPPSGYRTAGIPEVGANLSPDAILVLKLFTARYLSRNWKSIRKVVPLIFAAAGHWLRAGKRASPQPANEAPGGGTMDKVRRKSSRRSG